MASVPNEPPSPPRMPMPDPSVVKLTRGHSCILCQQRKVRCDKNEPCANCIKAGVDCRVVPPQPPRRRKKKPHEKELIDRLRKYEALLAQHGVNFEPIGNEFKTPDHGPVDEEVAELEQDMVGLKTSPSSGAGFNSPEQVRVGDDKPYNKWYPYYKEFKATNDLLGGDSSHSESEQPTLHNAFDTMYDSQDGFPFVIGGGALTTVTDKHPSAIQIFQLWQIYLNNVNPLLKLTHTATLQGQIIEAGANPGKISKGLEALMFSIYFMAVTSLTEEEVQSIFSEDKAKMVRRFHAGTQQSLLNAGFMRSPDLMVLQAYFMYLLCVRSYVDPRSLFCLIGIAVRIAQRLGLHRDGAQFGLPPFEVEQRRRLWWNLVMFDKRIAEITGSPITAFSSTQADCKWPLNINDSDLHLNAKDPPAPYTTPTEMIFCLTRIEMTSVSALSEVRPLPSSTPPVKSKFLHSSSPAQPDVLTHGASINLPQTDVDGYCNHVENVYLKQCDPKIPLQFFTLMMTRQNLCKLRVLGPLSRAAAQTEPMAAAEREALFVEAIRMIEYDNIIQSSESVRGYLWYTYLHFPFPAYMFLVNELRRTTTGELCERAWGAICENHERRGLIRNLPSHLHIVFGNMFLKAWDAREAVEAQLGRTLQPPKFIVLLCQRVAMYGPKWSGGKLQPGETAPNAMPQPQPQPQPEAALSSEFGMLADYPMFPGGFDSMGMGAMFGSALGQDDFSSAMDWNYVLQDYNMGNMYDGQMPGAMPGMPPQGPGMPPQGPGI